MAASTLWLISGSATAYVWVLHLCVHMYVYLASRCFFFASLSRLSNSYLCLLASIILHTGGSASGDINTTSRSRSSACWIASSRPKMPSISLSSPSSRTSSALHASSNYPSHARSSILNCLTQPYFVHESLTWAVHRTQSCRLCFAMYMSRARQGRNLHCQ